MAEIKRGKVEAGEGAHSPQDAAMRKLIEESLKTTPPEGSGARDLAGAAREMTVSVNPQGTLRNIGRWMYSEHLHRQPTDLELKSFVDDAARRNGLVSKEQRDNLQPGQMLRVMIPGSERAAETGVSKTAKSEPPKMGGEKKVAEAVVSKTAKSEPPKMGGDVKAEKTPAPKVETARAQNLETAKAAPRPETRHAIMKGGDTCEGDWAKMVAKWVTQNEGSRDKHLAYNANDMGHGISVGLLQWNQEKGKLPDLLKSWHDKNPRKFNTMFGEHSADLLKDSWVRTADFNGNKTLHSGMRKALADSEFQGVQDKLSNQNMVRACNVATDHGFRSLRGRAVVGDLFNQLGEGGARSALRKVPEGKGESLRIEELKKITGTRINGKDRVNTLEDNVKEIWRQIGGQT